MCNFEVERKRAIKSLIEESYFFGLILNQISRDYQLV